MADPGPLPRGDIIIKAVVYGPAPAADWQFSGDLGTFTLSAAGGSTTFTAQTAGSYWVTEAAVAGYSRVVSCTGGATGTGSVILTLDPAQSVTCTFTHTAEGIKVEFRLFAPAVLR